MPSQYARFLRRGSAEAKNVKDLMGRVLEQLRVMSSVCNHSATIFGDRKPKDLPSSLKGLYRYFKGLEKDDKMSEKELELLQPLAAEQESEKVTAILQHLEYYRSKGHKVIIFGEHTAFLNLLVRPCVPPSLCSRSFVVSSHCQTQDTEEASHRFLHWRSHKEGAFSHSQKCQGGQRGYPARHLQLRRKRLESSQV